MFVKLKVGFGDVVREIKMRKKAMSTSKDK